MKHLFRLALLLTFVFLTSCSSKKYTVLVYSYDSMTHLRITDYDTPKNNIKRKLKPLNTYKFRTSREEFNIIYLHLDTIRDAKIFVTIADRDNILQVNNIYTGNKDVIQKFPIKFEHITRYNE